MVKRGSSIELNCTVESGDQVVEQLVISLIQTNEQTNKVEQLVKNIFETEYLQ